MVEHGIFSEHALVPHVLHFQHAHHVPTIQHVDGMPQIHNVRILQYLEHLIFALVQSMNNVLIV